MLSCGFINVVSASNNHTTISTYWYQLWYAKFAKGTCTDYAASRRKDLFPSRSGKDRIFWGNAIAWLYNAKRAGIPTSKSPTPWAIAVFGPGRWASSSYGHVAIVEKVLDNGKIVVSDMNYIGRNRITTRIISRSLALGYIHKLPSKQHNEQDAKQQVIAVHIIISNEKENSSIGTVINKIDQYTLDQWTIISSHEDNDINSFPEWAIDHNEFFILSMIDTRYIVKAMNTYHHQTILTLAHQERWKELA